MRLRSLVLVPLAAAAILRGQEPLNRPVPLLQLSPAPSPGQEALSLEAARRAQELGLPARAAQIYRDLLAAPGGDRTGLTLALATALLDDGRPDQADQALRALPAPRGPPWHLRAGLTAVAQRKFDLARAELASIRVEDLAAPDRPWFFFLQGATAPLGDFRTAGDAYARANQAATTGLERARFWLAEEQVRLRAGPAAADAVENMHQNVDRFRGTATGHDFASSYAVMLDGLNRKAEAVDILRRELLTFQPVERARADDTRLLLGLIDGAAEGLGRNALMQLLDSAAALRGAPSADELRRQRVALQLLARDSSAGPARASFRAELDRLISAPNPHPILEDLLLFRAAWALGARPPEYPRAEDDAHELLDRFPGSSLKSYASGVLTASAWEQHKYRTAAAAAAQAEKADGPDRAAWSLLVAEAWFRSGDFRSSADAYAAVLKEQPPGVPPGELMFQRVEAEIEAAAGQTAPGDRFASATRVLDELSSNPAFDPADRWRAEWNLARMLQIDGQTQPAYARINRLLNASAPAPALSPELRARMAGLQAQLSFDAGEYGRTLDLAAALRRRLDGVPADLRGNIASTAELLEGQADFALNREKDGLAALQRLRAEFPGTDAAVHSYIVEADHYAQLEQISTAQLRLTELADKFPTSQEAPRALYQAALLAERLRQYAAANNLLENLVTLVKKNPDTDPRGDLEFYARLKQGDLMRELNNFPEAQRDYEFLRNNFPQHKDIVYALLALAECHDAQAAGNAEHAESARALLEDLIDRVDAPVDVRVEAGFVLGSLLADHGEAGQALKVWWRDVVTAFLLAPARAAELGAKGRYWMARTLLELGALDAKQGSLEEARRAWGLVKDYGLSDGARKLAQEDLDRLDAPAPKP